MRLVDRLVAEGVGRLHRRRLGRNGRPAPTELFEEIGAEVLRVEKLLEPDRGNLANLILGVIDPALLLNARADLLHDLLDVDRIGADVEISHCNGSLDRRLRRLLRAPATAGEFGGFPDAGPENAQGLRERPRARARDRSRLVANLGEAVDVRGESFPVLKQTSPRTGEDGLGHAARRSTGTRSCRGKSRSRCTPRARAPS